jgi:clan AA aspartic protease (TIGR02281 family)
MMLLAVATSATAAEYFKHVDRNGVETWINDKSKASPEMPTHYKYVDQNGISFWVDDVGKIPAEYRNQPPGKGDVVDKAKPGTDKALLAVKQYSTKISIVNNQIIVPVIFRNKGKKIKAKMLLDTGASVTILYKELAAKLNLKKNKLAIARSVNANGVSSDSIATKVDQIEIDDKILANAEVMIIPSLKNIGADGLLGNSFLRFFNFTIDYDKQLLRWN